jgi:3-hydroxyacyl-CoA dehydrogenase/enoyl-CoA hydratase/3-hydroxybutyryl-CoA epimerase
MSDPQLQHMRLERDDDRLAWLTLDVVDSQANTMGPAVLADLDRALQALEEQPPRGLIVRSAKSGFSAGADVPTLSRLESSDEVRVLIEQGQRVMDRIAGLDSPTIALVRGNCLGGGLELALACRYRVCDRDPATRLGLPEVRLGIHPGFGGTARLPALIGAPAALDLMLSGRTIDGRRAGKLGMVDYALSPWQLEDAARDLARRDPGRHQPPAWKQFLNTRPARALLRPYMERQLRAKARPEHYPAPYAMLTLWARHGGEVLPARLKAERSSLLGLVEGDTAAHLIRVFLLQDRLKQEARSADVTSPSRIHVVGAGTMGGDIAAWLALNGCRVTLADERHEAIAATLKRARKLFERRLKRPERVTAALDRLIPDPKGDGACAAELVIEAIIEDRPAKQRLYASLEQRIGDATVIATNTSSIPLESLAEGLQRPGRLIGLHFFNPVAKMPLVEVVAGGTSSEQALQQGQALMADADKLALRVRSGPGFLVNRLLMPYMLEAARRFAAGTQRESIDTAAKRFGMPMGPLELADSVGLDVCLAAADVMAEAQGLEVPASLRDRVDAGDLGHKSGRGFYTYDRKGQPDRQRVALATGDLDELGRELVAPLLDEAVRCRDGGVVADGDLVDAGAVFGCGFAPFTGGPLRYRQQRHATG